MAPSHGVGGGGSHEDDDATSHERMLVMEQWSNLLSRSVGSDVLRVVEDTVHPRGVLAGMEILVTWVRAKYALLVELGIGDEDGEAMDGGLSGISDR